MCGRFVDPNLRSMGLDTSWLKITPYPQRFNIKPTQEVYAIVGGQLVLARWGLVPSWHRGTLKEWKASTINARIEEVETKPAFRWSWREGRCLIPAGGYYEWNGEAPRKQPHFFSAAGNEPTLWFAGLVAIWQDMLTAAIMTRAANQSVAPVHDRMPVILNIEEQEAWLQGSVSKDLGMQAQLKHHPVARFKTDDDGPELIEPLP